EDFLRKCRSSSLVVKPKDLSSAEEVGRRILSITSSVRLILYVCDLRFLILSTGISNIFSGILVPIEVISGIGEEVLRDILRILKKVFRWVWVDLQEALPSVDLICTLMKAGIRDFMLGDDTTFKQAQLILRAERRVLLDIAISKLNEGDD
ncbi:MAG: hypothetical protein NZ992_06405, partial [Candidatus Korarchaeum sp.]|nr:hypothetical protein [Candidatus Korarchaeum sp.]MDW8035177.1 hypothetical protein [Candidatus Korarchaeum sp.]